MKAPWLTIVSITKDDPAGWARTSASAAVWRAHPGVEQVVVYRGTAPALLRPPHPVLQVQTSTGIARAFNEGLALAQGEWVWFLNGGDEVDPRLAPAWLEALLGHATSDIVIGGTTYSGEEVPRPHPLPERRWPLVLPWIPHPSALVRRRLLVRLGGFDPRYTIAMDYAWWMRALRAGANVDTLSVPFAIFADGGISQRTETRPRLRQENGDVLRGHAAYLWRGWLIAGARLLRCSLRAVFARRLGRGQPPAA